MPTQRKQWWNQSCAEADKAYPLSLEERVITFGRLKVAPEKPTLPESEEGNVCRVPYVRS